MNRPKARAEIVRVRPAGEGHQVFSLKGGVGAYRRQPCGGPTSTPERPGCPWRTDAAGHFPPEAFAHSAACAEDLSGRMFGCHEGTTVRPSTCAGFLLRGADHNMAVRMMRAVGRYDPSEVHDGGHELHPGYITMAVANGLNPEDPALAHARQSYREEGR